jgi:hypothetical protein
MKKPKLLLLDSDVVIHCHEIGVWEAIKAKFDVHVTSIVTDEAEYAKTPIGTVRIDLAAQAEREEVTIVEASAVEMFEITNRFADSFSQGLDDGETEGLAVLSRNDLDDCKFCCGDTNAQEAVGMLGLREQAISLEEILDFAGVRPVAPSQMKPHFRKSSLEIHTNKGAARRITGECFKKSPLGL